MNDALAHECLSEVLELLNRYGDVYDRRWGYRDRMETPALDSQLHQHEDEVRGQTRFARDVIVAMGENELALKVVEHDEVVAHSFTQARKAIVEAIAILAQREKLAQIVGPVGPRLSASELHPTIWGAAAGLYDDRYFPQAVQTAASALESLFQGKTHVDVSGENLGNLFSTNDPTQGSPRLRLRDVADPSSKTFKSAHEGAAALVRGAFMAVRNLVSHPGWPEPTPSEALEMLAVLSYVAHLVDRSDTETAN